MSDSRNFPQDPDVAGPLTFEEARQRIRDLSNKEPLSDRGKAELADTVVGQLPARWSELKQELPSFSMMGQNLLLRHMLANAEVNGDPTILIDCLRLCGRLQIQQQAALLSHMARQGVVLQAKEHWEAIIISYGDKGFDKRGDLRLVGPEDREQLISMMPHKPNRREAQGILRILFDWLTFPPKEQIQVEWQTELIVDLLARFPWEELGEKNFEKFWKLMKHNENKTGLLLWHQGFCEICQHLVQMVQHRNYGMQAQLILRQFIHSQGLFLQQSTNASSALPVEQIPSPSTLTESVTLQLIEPAGGPDFDPAPEATLVIECNQVRENHFDKPLLTPEELHAPVSESVPVESNAAFQKDGDPKQDEEPNLEKSGVVVNAPQLGDEQVQHTGIDQGRSGQIRSKKITPRRDHGNSNNLGEWLRGVAHEGLRLIQAQERINEVTRQRVSQFEGDLAQAAEQLEAARHDLNEELRQRKQLEHDLDRTQAKLDEKERYQQALINRQEELEEANCQLGTKLSQTEAALESERQSRAEVERQNQEEIRIQRESFTRQADEIRQIVSEELSRQLRQEIDSLLRSTVANIEGFCSDDRQRAEVARLKDRLNALKLG